MCSILSYFNSISTHQEQLLVSSSEIEPVFCLWGGGNSHLPLELITLSLLSCKIRFSFSYVLLFLLLISSSVFTSKHPIIKHFLKYYQEYLLWVTLCINSSNPIRLLKTFDTWKLHPSLKYPIKVKQVIQTRHLYKILKVSFTN